MLVLLHFFLFAFPLIKLKLLRPSGMLPVKGFFLNCLLPFYFFHFSSFLNLPSQLFFVLIPPFQLPYSLFILVTLRLLIFLDNRMLYMRIFELIPHFIRRHIRT